MQRKGREGIRLCYQDHSDVRDVVPYRVYVRLQVVGGQQVGVCWGQVAALQRLHTAGSRQQGQCQFQHS